MSYAHIENLYKQQTIRLFRECYALEKVHGTSARLLWRNILMKKGSIGVLNYSAGGEESEPFRALFDDVRLRAGFMAMGHEKVAVFGEAHGGPRTGQAWRYGDALKFVVFDVKIKDLWLSVPQAADVTAKLGLEFVHYAKVSTDLAALDAERDAPSVQAVRNGVVDPQPREGVVLRSLLEMRLNNDERIICKHKRDDERETLKTRPIVDPAKLEVLTAAQAIAEEWVTPTRLLHVLDKLPAGLGIRDTGKVVAAMVEDVVRESVGEIVDSKDARQAIGRKAAELFHERLKPRDP
jgi:hypothetical protein